MRSCTEASHTMCWDSKFHAAGCGVWEAPGGEIRKAGAPGPGPWAARHVGSSDSGCKAARPGSALATSLFLLSPDRLPQPNMPTCCNSPILQAAGSVSPTEWPHLGKLKNTDSWVSPQSFWFNGSGW